MDNDLRVQNMSKEVPGLVLGRRYYEAVIIEGILKVIVLPGNGNQVKLKFVDLTDHQCHVEREERIVNVDR